jgi:hypothetical protein
MRGHFTTRPAVILPGQIDRAVTDRGVNQSQRRGLAGASPPPRLNNGLLHQVLRVGLATGMLAREK